MNICVRRSFETESAAGPETGTRGVTAADARQFPYHGYSGIVNR